MLASSAVISFVDPVMISHILFLDLIFGDCFVSRKETIVSSMDNELVDSFKPHLPLVAGADCQLSSP